MRSQTEIQEIIELITKWFAKISLNTALQYYDINKVSENLALKVLNTIYDYELVNLNHLTTNIPGVDLGDNEKAKICVQVTSRTDMEKIVSTLTKFVDSKYDFKDTYNNGIKFFILNLLPPKITDERKLKKIYSNFSIRKDIITFKSLIHEIDKLYQNNRERYFELKEILYEEFGVENVLNANNYFFFSNNFRKSNKNLNDEILQKIEKELLPQYLNSIYNSFKSIKTFLSSKQRPFYDLYFSVKLENLSTNQFYCLGEVKKFLFKSNYSTIHGMAGSGKSTLIKHIFIDILKHFLGIPVVIELRYLNTHEGSFFDYIKSQLFIMKLSLQKRQSISF